MIRGYLRIKTYVAGLARRACGTQLYRWSPG